MRWKLLPAIVGALAVMLSGLAAVAQQPPPNILVIMGDDIGYWNISAYNRGQMLRPVRACGTGGLRLRQTVRPAPFLVVPAQTIVAQQVQSVQEFPPRQKPGSFSADQAVESC